MREPNINIFIDHDAAEIIADTPYRRGNVNFRDLLARVPAGRWDRRRNVWRYPATPAVARAMLDAIYGVVDEASVLWTVTDTLDPDIRALASRHAVAPRIRDCHESALDSPLSTDDMPPYDHQRRGYNMIREQAATMLAFDMGTGKSKVIVDTINTLTTTMRRVLIVCPCSVMAVWRNEFRKHAVVPVKLTVLDSGQSTKKRHEQAKRRDREAFYERIPHVVVVNYEATRYDPLRSWLDSVPWSMTVCDESHRIKSPGGRDSRFLARIGRRSERRVCLTGTPMAHSPMDVYGQYRFLDPGIFGSSFARFRDRYATMGGYLNKEVVGYRNEDELHERFYSIGYRVMKDEVLDLPEVVHETIPVTLCPEARRVYTDLERFLVAQTAAGEVTASNGLSKLLRLQQVTSGLAATADADGVTIIDSAKRDTLADLLRDIPINEPVVVFCRFRHDIEQACAAAQQAGRGSFRLLGGTNESADWQSDTRGSVLATQIQAGGVGMDFTRARYCVYYSLGFSLGDYVQSEARIHRQGQTRRCEYFHLLAENTVDERVYSSLRQKTNVIESVLEYLSECDE
jgi:SNF2 family DNA or RNA helicase